MIDKIKMRNLTKIFIIVMFAVIVVYDIIACIVGGNSTISNVIMTWSLKNAFIPLFFGIMGGHFFITSKLKSRYILLAIIFIIIGTAGTIIETKINTAILPFVFVVIGVPMGALMWPQHRADKG